MDGFALLLFSRVQVLGGGPRVELEHTVGEASWRRQQWCLNEHPWPEWNPAKLWSGPKSMVTQDQ